MITLGTILPKLGTAYKQDTLQFWSAVVSVTGVYLVSENILLMGWSINLGADALWVWWGAIHKAHFLIALQVVFVFIAINGIINV